MTGDTAACPLTVVVVSFNCRELLDDCLRSLAPDRHHVDAQVIVVDNASVDGTPDLVRDDYPWVDLLVSPVNYGFAKANNLGLTKARGHHLLLLNPDTVVPPGALDDALAALERRPEVGVLGCRLVLPDGTLDHACKRGLPTPSSAVAYFTGVARRRPTDARSASYTAGGLGEHEEGDVGAVNGAFMLVRREALDEVGPLDETFWMYGEDLDWCLRFWEAGWKVRYWPGLTVIHVKGGTSGKRRKWQTNRAFHEAMWLYYRKHEAPKRNVAMNLTVRLAITARLLATTARPRRGTGPVPSGA